MKTSTPLSLMLTLLAGLAAGCGKSGGQVDEYVFGPPDALDEVGIPSWASARFDIAGLPALGGAFQIVVGPDGRQVLNYSGTSGGSTVSLAGSFELVGSQQFTASAAPSTMNWVTPTPEAMLSSPSQFYYIKDGVQHNYLTSKLTMAVSAAGTLSVELRGVSMDRVDTATKTVRPGEDLIVRVTGRLTGTCRVRQTPGNPDSPVLLDPTNSTADCKAILSSL